MYDEESVLMKICTNCNLKKNGKNSCLETKSQRHALVP
jgi:hypothetical protein